MIFASQLLSPVGLSASHGRSRKAAQSPARVSEAELQRWVPVENQSGPRAGSFGWVAGRRVELDPAEAPLLKQLHRLLDDATSPRIGRGEGDHELRELVAGRRELLVLDLDRLSDRAGVHVLHLHRQDDEARPLRVVTAEQLEDPSWEPYS